MVKEKKKRRPNKAGMGSGKGNGFERKICKVLSLWATAGTDENVYWRTATSGARASHQIKKGINIVTQLGDISSLEERGSELTKNFIVECKFIRKLNIEQTLILGHGKLFKFWHKLLKQCETHTPADRPKLLPLMIAKQNGFPELLITDHHGERRLGLNGVGPWSQHFVADVPALGMRIYQLTILDHAPWPF